MCARPLRYIPDLHLALGRKVAISLDLNSRAAAKLASKLFPFGPAYVLC